MKKLIIFICCLQIMSCYSFKGISISPDVNTYFVETLEDQTGELPIGFNQEYSEGLTEKIQSETRLSLSNDNADITFSGSFVRFEIRSEDPNDQEQTSLNRLYFAIQITYYNSVSEEEWTKKYEEVADFSATQSFIDVQEELFKEVTERINERIFQDAFTNW